MGSNRQLIIIGKGGLAREAADIARIHEYDEIKFIDKESGDEFFSSNPSGNCIIAIGYPRIKHAIVSKIKQLRLYENFNWINLVHPTATIGFNDQIGIGVIIQSGVSITTDCKIGDHCLINCNCTIGHDAVINDFCVVNPNSSICGNAVIGHSTLIGTHACVLEKRTVGCNAVVGAGSAVIRDVPDFVTVIGVPAHNIFSRGLNENSD